MRTLLYLATGVPKNRADCFDYHRTISKAVSVKLLTFQTETVVDYYFITNCFGSFRWVFEDGREVIFDDLFGGILLHESDKRQSVSVQNANRRLKNRMSDMESRLPFKIEVITGLF